MESESRASKNTGTKRLSPVWVIRLILLFAAVYGGFLGFGLLLYGKIPAQSTVPWAIMSGIIAFVPCFIGFFGGRWFYGLSLAGILFGIGYLYYTAYTQVDNEWVGLLAPLGFFVCVVLGLALGTVGQIIALIFRKGKKKKYMDTSLLLEETEQLTHEKAVEKRPIYLPEGRLQLLLKEAEQVSTD